jgi:hypothetical protein
VDPRLDQDEPELGVFVLAVTLEVFADCYGLEVERVSGGSEGEHNGEGGKGERGKHTFLMSM